MHTNLPGVMPYPTIHRLADEHRIANTAWRDALGRWNVFLDLLDPTEGEPDFADPDTLIDRLGRRRGTQFLKENTVTEAAGQTEDEAIVRFMSAITTASTPEEADAWLEYGLEHAQAEFSEDDYGTTTIVLLKKQLAAAVSALSAKLAA